MPTWLKVVLALLVVAVLCVAGLIGGGYYLWKQHGPQLVANVERGEKEGRTFAAQADNQGCVDEGVKRFRDATGLTDYMKHGIFVRSCLDHSRETPGFCDAVPGPFEITKTIKWRKEQCVRYDLTEAQQCSQLFQQVQQFCQTRSFRHADNDNTDADNDNSKQ
ncbi:MAG: hypothetical protein QOE33_2662 [Acidobacteriota bacterium]|nr:hypothetical protein [Acidobacteriota bacterium]